MSEPPRDMRQWMRQVERKLQQAIRSGNAGLVTKINAEIADVKKDIANSGGDTRTPAAPIELVVQTGIYTNRNGENRGRVIVSHPPVTLATDATDILIDGYQIWGREETDWDGTLADEPSWVLIRTNAGTKHVMRDLDPGSVWRYRFRAVGETTVFPGEWSDEVLVEVGTDTVAPPIPAPLELTQNLGVVVAHQNGLGANGADMPADYHHTELAMGTQSSPTALVDDQLVGAGDVMFIGLEKDRPYYFRCRTVDWSGNASSWSQNSTITVEWLVTGDISGLNTTIQQQVERTEEAERKAVESAQQALEARERAEDAIDAAKAAQGEADSAAKDAAAVAAEAAALQAEAAAARSSADQAALEAEQARQAALEARANSKDSFQEVHDFLAGQGGVLHQETAPTGEDAHDGNVWIKDSTGEAFVWDNSTTSWILTDDAVLLAAAAEADNAQDAALAAEQAAVTAQDYAQVKRAEAIIAETEALTKERAAEAAESKSRTSGTLAEEAEAASAAASNQLATELSELEATLGTTPYFQQSEAPIDTSALWIDDENNALVFKDLYPEDEVPAEWMLTDDISIRHAVRSWTNAQEALAAADAEANRLRTEATAAQTAATDARSAATAARTAADSATATANQADLDAQQALVDARNARTLATRSLRDVQAFAGTSGGTAYQEEAPENPKINMLWIVPSTGISYVWNGTAWREVVNTAVAAATRAADQAADRARAAEAAADRASAAASRASNTAEIAATEAGGLRGLATSLASSADQAEQDATTAESLSAIAAQEAADALANIDSMIPGTAYHSDTEPASTSPDDLWIDDATGQAKVYDTSQGAWIVSSDPTLASVALDVDAKYDQAAASQVTANTLRDEATDARTKATNADADADAAEANAAQLEQAAEAAQAQANTLLSDAAALRSTATQALRNVSGVISDAGEVLIQDETPPADFQSPDNLWIDKSSGDPFVWNNSAWVAETDPEIVALASDAAAAKRAAETAEANAQQEQQEALAAQQDAAAAGQIAGGAGEAATEAQARANKAQAEADAAKREAEIAATDAASAWKDANSAAQSAGSSSAAAILAEERAEAAQEAADAAAKLAGGYVFYQPHPPHGGTPGKSLWVNSDTGDTYIRLEDENAV